MPSRPYMFVILLASLLLATVPSALAHAVRAPCAWEQRVIHDHTDDMSANHIQGDNGHELHALDIVEAWEPTLADVLVFRLSYDGGYADSPGGLLDTPRPGKLTDVVSFTADGKAFSFTWTTTDNAAFTGTFDKIVQPTQVTKSCDTTEPDGTRQVVEGWVALGKNQIAPDAKLGAFKVEGYADDAKKDVMGQGTTKGDDSNWFVLNEYTLGSKRRIIDASFVETTLEMNVGENRSLQLNYGNQAGKSLDTRIVYAGPDGTRATFHLDEATGYKEGQLAFQAAKGEDGNVHVSIEADRPVAGGTMSFEVFGDTGSYVGHVRLTLPLTAQAVQAPTSPTPTLSTPPAASRDDGVDGNGTTESAPAPPLPMLVVLAAATVALVRRKGTA